MNLAIGGALCVVGAVCLMWGAHPDQEIEIKSVGGVRADGVLELGVPSLVIPSSDLDKSVEFYGKVLGVSVIRRENTYALIGDDTRSVRIVLASSITPSNYPAVAWFVEDLEKVVAELVSRGVKLVGDVPDGPRYFGNFVGGKSAYGLLVKDPDGMLIAFVKR